MASPGLAPEPSTSPWRYRLYTVIFEADTDAGKTFDVFLLWAILLSVASVLLESIDPVRAEYGGWLKGVEIFFTILFTIEYVIRLLSVKAPARYALSFFGIVDLLAVVPTYLSVLVPGAQSLLVVRAFRLLRIFRVFKLGRYLQEARILLTALQASRPKVTVFLVTVLSIVLVMGAAMYLIEGADSGFTSIPRSMYWAVVTLTTVGYGDIAPQTVPGQILASIIMILGYGIIAVPTGIMSVELATATREYQEARQCEACRKIGHAPDAWYCRHCGAEL